MTDHERLRTSRDTWHAVAVFALVVVFGLIITLIGSIAQCRAQVFRLKYEHARALVDIENYYQARIARTTSAQPATLPACAED